jgi:glucokinase
VLASLWRGPVDPATGPEGIRRQIVAAVPELLERSGVARDRLRGVGIGFGGPVDDATHTIIKSHQIDGWDGFPLADWISDLVELPAALGNDADVAGLAEALFGAGKGLSPIFYITVGSGIGGGLIINGEIYRGVGRGAAEIGHLQHTLRQGAFLHRRQTLEDVASGWGISRTVELLLNTNIPAYNDSLLQLLRQKGITAQDVAAAAEDGDQFAQNVLSVALEMLGDAICNVIALLCPRRIVIGGGVSLIGEKLFFEPLQRHVAEHVFRPFTGLTDIVPAALGEAVVVHGALALARRKLAQ